MWAGVIGIIFGLVIGFGAWRVRYSMKPKGNPTPTATPQTGVGQFKITLNKPENFDVLTATPVEVTGITKPLTWVVVSSSKGDFLTQSAEDGTFSIDVGLVAGINFIKASSVNIQGSTSTPDIFAVYSASFITSNAAVNNATGEADIQNAVAQKLAQAQKPPKAYIGTVTDITDSTIQIKTTDSQIRQIATDKGNVAVVNTKGTNNKAVKITDIAIGDFIVAMGYVDGNEVLDSQRILIADPPTELQIGVSMAKVAKVTVKSVVLSSVSGGDSTTITPDKNTGIRSYSGGTTKTIKLAAIKPSDLIILVTDASGTPSLTRSIFDLGAE